MATIEFTGKGWSGLKEAPETGWFKPKGAFSADYLGGAAGIGEFTLSRNWSAKKSTVTDTTGRVRGQHEWQGWTASKGPLEWDDVQYEFGVLSSWRSSFVLRRHNEELATISPKGFAGNRLQVEILDNAHVPPGLIVFVTWLAAMRIRDNDASSSAST